jgi:large subunit ribosomal protein L23
MKDLRDIVRRPLITEKSSDLRDEHHKYVFEVDKRANKIEIKEAVEALFDVKVLNVRTLKIHGKPKQMRPYPAGKRPDWKKAIVTVEEGNQIDIFHEV